jgi:hypothetical protein
VGHSGHDQWAILVMIYNIHSTSITGLSIFSSVPVLAIYRWYYLLKFEEFS